MQRLNDRLAAALAVGASFALAMAPATGQIADEPGFLRPSMPALPDGGAASPPIDPTGRRAVFEVPVYGNPAGSGAGTTGFVSGGTVRRKGRPKPKSALLQPQNAIPAAIPAAPPTATPPAALPGTAGLRPVPQLARHGVPLIDPAPTLAPAPLVVAPQRRATVDPTPFDALGLRAGVFLIRPAVELTAGYDSNPQRAPIPRGTSEIMVAPELIVRSDWERHALNADIHGSYTAFGRTFPDSPHSLDRPTLDSRLSGRIDVSSADRVNLESRLLLSTDNPGSPNIQAGLARLPIVTTVGGTAGYAHDFNRLEIAAKADIDRSVYQNSSLTDGTSASNDDRNFNQYAGTLRGSYELMPGVKPFVEAAIDTRIHDITIDRTGSDRDSQGRTFRIGTTFRLTGKLSGEASFGQTQREYKDPLLPRLSGPTFDAALLYAATPLTTMKFTATSTAGELILPGASGVLRRDFGFEIDHDFRRWLTGVVKLGYGADTYFGLDRFDNRYSAGVSLGYKLTRTVQIRGEFRHEWLRSSIGALDYDANIALLTVRLQR